MNHGLSDIFIVKFCFLNSEFVPFSNARETGFRKNIKSFYHFTTFFLGKWVFVSNL